MSRKRPRKPAGGPAVLDAFGEGAGGRRCACGVTSMAVRGRSGSADRGANVFLPRPAEVLRIEEPAPLVRRLVLRHIDKKPFDWAPGQFLEVSLFGYGEIPIGLASSRTRGNSFEIVVRSVGRASQAIHRLVPGDRIFLRGPLGKGFPLGDLRGRDVLIVAGGLGLAPTRSLIQHILDRRAEFGRFILFYGTREPAQQLFRTDLAAWRRSGDIEYHETVDRAPSSWKGGVGVITRLFQKTTLTQATRAVICGPPIMFRFVLQSLEGLGIPKSNVWVDLERRMKCGLGRCGHCQIGDRYVCTDGPVFSVAGLADIPEAL